MLDKQSDLWVNQFTHEQVPNSFGMKVGERFLSAVLPVIEIDSIMVFSAGLSQAPKASDAKKIQ